MSAIRASLAPVSELEVPRTVYGIGVGIAVLAVLGAADALVTNLPALDLQRELADGFNLPVLFSGAILILAAILAGRCAHAAARRGDRTWAWIGAAAMFAYFGVDEMLAIHDNIETSTGVEWQFVYLPVFALAAVFWASVLRGLAERAARLLWVGAAAAWVVSQSIEGVTYGLGLVDAERAVAGANEIEELLEMVGTGLFIWTMLFVLAELRT